VATEGEGAAEGDVVATVVAADVAEIVGIAATAETAGNLPG